MMMFSARHDGRLTLLWETPGEGGTGGGQRGDGGKGGLERGQHHT